MEGTERRQDELKSFIEKVIASEYAKHKKQSTARVFVYENEITIWFNLEKPYLGEAFWKILKRVSDMIDERLKSEGYEFSSPKCMHNFFVYMYLRRLSEPEDDEVE